MRARESFRRALEKEKPLQVVGCINAYVALMAERLGFHAIYLSGSGVASASYGLPDLALTTLDNVLEDVRRITGAVDLPLLVDIDTGWGSALMIARSIREMYRAGAAAVHLEDQVVEKRCGHRPGKAIVPTSEMVDRIQAAVDAKPDADFVVMARTDAYASEGLERAMERCLAYRDAGADMIFLEAVTELDHYRQVKEALGIPLLANLTEFGKTPLFTLDELQTVGVDIALYPLSANRAMSKAAWQTLEVIRGKGTQQSALEMMQTREELYDVLQYYSYEEKIDQLYRKQGINI